MVFDKRFFVFFEWFSSCQHSGQTVYCCCQWFVIDIYEFPCSEFVFVCVWNPFIYLSFMIVIIECVWTMLFLVFDFFLNYIWSFGCTFQLHVTEVVKSCVDQHHSWYVSRYTYSVIYYNYLFLNYMNWYIVVRITVTFVIRLIFLICVVRIVCHCCLMMIAVQMLYYFNIYTVYHICRIRFNAYVLPRAMAAV